jgi:hypothetical protein
MVGKYSGQRFTPYTIAGFTGMTFCGALFSISLTVVDKAIHLEIQMIQVPKDLFDFLGPEQ